MSNRGPTPTRYVKKTRVPWSSRLGNAFQGILVGLLLVVAGLILLFYTRWRDWHSPGRTFSANR